jgi:CubicO group peptidase (beta-lactamase class C family)
MSFLSPQRIAMRHPIIVRLLAVASLGLLSLVARAEESAESAIAGVFSKFVKPGEPGCSVGVKEGASLTHALAFGQADIARGKALDARSIVNLASVSKQFTAFAVLLLQKDGKLSIDDPVAKHLPELSASAKGVTLRHLMHHTGGLRDYIALIAMEGRDDSDGATIHEAVQALARQTRPNEAPGVEYEYSNTGYFLLGVVVARVSGQTLAEFSRQRIFEPLGMRNTTIVDRYPDGIPALARGYSKSGKGGFLIDETGWEQVGDGQVHSDLHDLALWDENFYSAKVGGREVIDQMLEAGKLESGKSVEYGGGLSIDDSRGLRVVSHGGSWVGYRSYLMRVPEEHFSVIVLCNRADADTGSLANSVATIFLDGKLGPEQPEEDEPAPEKTKAGWDPGDLTRYVGSYFSTEADAHCRLYAIDESLVVEGCAEGAVLRPGKPGEFVDVDESFTLRFTEGGKSAAGFTYDTFGLRGLPFEKVEERFE